MNIQQPSVDGWQMVAGCSWTGRQNIWLMSIHAVWQSEIIPTIQKKIMVHSHQVVEPSQSSPKIYLLYFPELAPL